MRVEIKMQAELSEPCAVIYAGEITEEIRRIVSFIENSNCMNFVTVNKEDRIYVLQPDEIYMVRVENEKTIVYCEAQKYSSGRRLYEFETLLGSSFMRISKSTLVNLKYLACVEPSFSGTMLLVLKNGCKDYISRKYLPNLKKYLGI